MVVTYFKLKFPQKTYGICQGLHFECVSDPFDLEVTLSVSDMHVLEHTCLEILEQIRNVNIALKSRIHYPERILSLQGLHFLCDL